MSGATRLAAALVLAAVLALPSLAAAACVDCLEAGAASVRLVVPAGTPLAGYSRFARRIFPDVLGRYPHAFWFRPSEGELDPLAARALVLARGDTRLAWVTLDVVVVDRGFTREVARRLAGPDGGAPTVIVSASHTHSGPGAFIDSELFGALASDRLDTSVRAALLDAAVDAVRRADRERAPARVAVGEVAAPREFTLGRLGLPVDPALVVLKVTRASGEPVAALWNYAIHGTMLGARNLKFSGDVMGVASREVERALGVPVLFVNGAVGDVSPAGHGPRAIGGAGRVLAEVVERAWAVAEPIDGTLRVGRLAVDLPSARLSLANCTRGWVPRFLALPLGSALPREAELVAVAIGDSAWVAVPGELQTALGQAIKRGGRARFAHVAVAGVSNDYLGYFVTAQDYRRPGYVTCAALYGSASGGCLASAAADLVDSLGASGPRRDDGRARTSSGRRYCGG